MSKVYELKVFKNGGSNAVRIPAGIEIFDGKLFLVLGDDGTITLERNSPQPMAGFFALLDELAIQPEAVEAEDVELPRVIGDQPDREWMDYLEVAFAKPGGDE